MRRMKLENKIRHMVRTEEMRWLRTTLAIFRRAVWAETCCCAPKVWCFQSGVRSASSPSLSKKPLLCLFLHRQRRPASSQQLQVAVACWCKVLWSHLMGGLLYWSFAPHRSWPWGRTAVVTTTSWPTLWVIIRRLPWGGAGLVLFCMCINSNLHALYLSYRLLCKREHIFFLSSSLLCLFINNNMADRLNCVFPRKWMSHAINKQHSTFLSELCGAVIFLSLSVEGNIHLALRI